MDEIPFVLVGSKIALIAKILNFWGTELWFTPKKKDNFFFKTCKIVIAHRKSKNAPRTRTAQVSKKWVRTRTSQLATAHRNSQLAIAHRKSCLANYLKLQILAPYKNLRIRYDSEFAKFWPRALAMSRLTMLLPLACLKRYLLNVLQSLSEFV